jgi:hypothetical protein
VPERDGDPAHRFASVRLIGFDEILEESLNCPQTPAGEFGDFGQCVSLATEIDHHSAARRAGPAEHRFSQYGGVEFQRGRRLAVDHVVPERHQSTPWRSGGVKHPALGDQDEQVRAEFDESRPVTHQLDDRVTYEILRIIPGAQTAWHATLDGPASQGIDDPH